MNGQERFFKALKREPVDKLPCHWHHHEPAGLYAKQLMAFLDRDDNPELEQCFEMSPIGDLTLTNWYSRGTSSDMGIGAGGVPFPLVYYNRKKDWFYTAEEAKSLSTEDKNFTITMTGAIRQSGYHLGKPGERPSTYWWEIDKFFDRENAVERFEAFFNEFGHPWEFEFNPKAASIKSARDRIKQFSDYGFPHAVEGHAPFHFEAIWYGFGARAFAKLSRSNPRFMHDVCKKFEKVCLVSEQMALEAGHQIISTGDDLGQKDRTLVSPKVYHEFFFPALKSRCDLAHKYGAAIWMHSCGFIEEFLDEFLAAKLDGLQSLEVPAGNDLARIRAKVRDNLCLIGGIDSSRVMTFGTPAECDAHAKVQIKKATTLDGTSMDTGYIPGPAHDLLDTPLVNVQAVIAAIAKYGKCPLNL